MDETLLGLVARYAEAHADKDGIARSPIPGLSLIRAMAPSALQYAVSRPLVALVLQGEKRVAMGPQTFDFGAGESLLITADVPTVSQITGASPRAPYFSLVFELHLDVIEGLAREIDAVPDHRASPVSVDRTEKEVAESARRLMLLLDRPGSLRVLQDQSIRELHYWLLIGRHGGPIRRLGHADSQAARVARAVAIIRSDFAKTLRVEQLADAAGMSPSTFHEHFRAVTSLTPLQFQKQLRLIEARRMMIEGASISNAAFAVGYESVPQFTREYARLFSRPPGRDMKLVKGRMSDAA
jgi:AraC-like DNA-binding protein